MITVQEALKWLNWEEGKDHLSGGSSFSIWEITDSVLSEPDRNAAVDTLSCVMRNHKDPLEKAEVYVKLAVDRHTRRYHDQARRLLLDALEIYSRKNDCHREAVTEWITFIVRYAMLERTEAHSHARGAFQIFTEQSQKYNLRGKAGVTQVNWYDDKIKAMTCDLDAIPEEPFDWLIKFNASKLSISAKQASEKISKAIKDKCFTEAYQQIQMLRNITMHSPEILETAEAQAFCGLSFLQMGNCRDAVRYIESAMAHATHSKHHHTSIRWMLGLVLFEMPSERCNGITHLEACFRGFDEMRVQADRRNNPDAVTWYKTQLQAMETVLKDFVRSDP